MPDEPKIPKLTGDKSGTPLRLSASEGFVLSRIDGKANEAELAGLTGLHESQIRATLEKLVSLRVITLEAREAPISAQATSVARVGPGRPGPGGAPPSPPPSAQGRSDEPAQGAVRGPPGADAPVAPTTGSSLENAILTKARQIRLTQKDFK